MTRFFIQFKIRLVRNLQKKNRFDSNSKIKLVLNSNFRLLHTTNTHSEYCQYQEEMSDSQCHLHLERFI